MTRLTRKPWAQRAVVVSTLVMGLFVPPATGQEAAHRGKSQGPVVILPPPGAAFGITETAPASFPNARRDPFFSKPKQPVPHIKRAQAAIKLVVKLSCSRVTTSKVRSCEATI